MNKSTTRCIRLPTQGRSWASSRREAWRCWTCYFSSHSSSWDFFESSRSINWKNWIFFNQYTVHTTNFILNSNYRVTIKECYVVQYSYIPIITFVNGRASKLLEEWCLLSHHHSHFWNRNWKNKGLLNSSCNITLWSLCTLRFDWTWFHRKRG